MSAAPAPSASDSAAQVFRRWTPTVIVAAAILALTLGGRVAATTVTDGSVPTVGVDGVATIHPPPGWTEDVAARSTTDSARRFVLTKGSAVVALTVVPEADVAAPTLADVYVREVLGSRVLQLDATSPQQTTVGGLPGIRIVYLGVTSERAAVEGVVAVAVAADGAGVVIDGFAPEWFLASVADDLQSMIEGAEVG